MIRIRVNGVLQKLQLPPAVRNLSREALPNAAKKIPKAQAESAAPSHNSEQSSQLAPRAQRMQASMHVKVIGRYSQRIPLGIGHLRQNLRVLRIAAFTVSSAVEPSRENSTFPFGAGIGSSCPASCPSVAAGAATGVCPNKPIGEQSAPASNHIPATGNFVKNPTLSTSSEPRQTSEQEPAASAAPPRTSPPRRQPTH